MEDLTLEDIKTNLELSSSKNVYFSYEYPKNNISLTRNDFWYGYKRFTVDWNFSLLIESDYGLIQSESQIIKLSYTKSLIDYNLEKGPYTVEMRKYLRDKTLPIIDSLIAMGFENETDIEDFILLKKNSLHFTRISKKEKEAILKKKAEEEKSLRLKEYILIIDDSWSIKSSDIQRFQSLSKSSDIVMTLGTEEIKETNETIGYIEFIPTTFNDSIRVAFLLCETAKFNENRESINTTNRILRFMLPICEILRKDFAIDTENVLSIAKGESTGPIIINRNTPLDSITGASKEILQLSDLAEELNDEPVDMIVVSCKDNIWDLSFSNGKLLKIDAQGQKEHSLNVIKHELLNHGYFIHEPAFDNYMKKANFSKNLYFKKNRNN